MEKIKIEYIPISEIKPYPNNPRKNKKAIEVVKKSIAEFGFKNPIILDKNNEIAGHTRLSASKELDYKEVPVIRAEDLTEEQVKEFRIADNKSQEFSIWDEEKLIKEFDNLENIENTFFSESEVEYILDKFELEKEKLKSAEVEDFNLKENKYNIKPGDIIIFENKHKVICGNSKDKDLIKKMILNEKIDLVVTSPPYNLNIKYGEYKDNKEFKEYFEDMKTIFNNLKDFMNKGRYLCINIGREWGPVNLPAKYDLLMEMNGYSFFRNIYWKKPLGASRGTSTSRNPFPRYYIPKVQTEQINIYQFDQEKPEFLDMMITYKYQEGMRDKEEKIPKELLSKYAGNVWSIMTETHQKNHSAPFPVQIPFNCIKFFTKEQENILDPFMGSGTTLIAGEQAKRKVYGIELDPNYCGLIIDRYKKLKPDCKIEVESNGNKKRRYI